MSLESKIGERFADSFLRGLFFNEFNLKMPLMEGYKRYVNKHDFEQQFVVNSSGRIVFGGIHSYAYQMKKIGGTIFLEAIHKHGDPNSQHYKEDGSSAFGGLHVHFSLFYDIKGTQYLFAQHDKNGLWGFYREDGVCFSSLVDAGLSQVRGFIEPLGLFGELSGSLRFVYDNLKGNDEDKNKFLSGVISNLNGLASSYHGDTLRNALKQFLFGLDKLAGDPNFLGYVCGGLGR